MTKRQARKYFTGSHARVQLGRRIRMGTWTRAYALWRRWSGR